MGLHLSLRVALLFIIYAQNITVFAAGNVTIDDNDSSIKYSDGWSRELGNTLDFLSAHMQTQNKNATASFNFTGTAIYFLSPLWPFRINTAVSLDSDPATQVDLQDHSRPDAGSGAQTVHSQVVWSHTGLSNTQHNLLMSVGEDQSYAVIDALMYTTTENITSPSCSPSSLSPTPTSQDPNVPSSSSESKSKSGVVIALGSLLGIFGLSVIVGGVWYFFRHRKRPILEARTVDDASHATSMLRHTNTSAVGPNTTNSNMGNRSAEPLYNSRSSTSQPGFSWHNLVPSGTMTGQRSDNYELGHTLSTTAEGSTPQMADSEGMPLLATALPSYELDAEYHRAAQGAEASHSVSRIQQQGQKPGIVVLEYRDDSSSH